jgi:MoxR-like ATPase
MRRDSLAERLLRAERGLRNFKPADAAAAFDPTVQAAMQAMHAAQDQIAGVILGKERQIRLTLACVLARGHLLLEDLPGVGKTTLAHAIARSLGLQFQRIQFTSDLLPADIIGVSIFDRQHGGFRFHPGPIFAQMILADEVNRATPKAQSALLEAMEEQQVTAEGETRPLPQPFFVIATQNPSHQVGTFPLPESQLDRFLMCIQLGYPDAQAERRLLESSDRRDLLAALPPCLGPEQLLILQHAARTLHVAPALLDYLQALLARSREGPEFVAGLSPRAGLNALHAARAWALLDARNFVMPEDVQAVLPSVIAHRLQPSGGRRGADADEAVTRLLAQVPIP